jgi:hypothetical protein
MIQGKEKSGSPQGAGASRQGSQASPVSLRDCLVTLQASREFYAMKGDLESVEELSVTILAIERAIVRSGEAVAEPAPPCGTCNGTRLVDSGGQNPDGSWINRECPECTPATPSQESR